MPANGVLPQERIKEIATYRHVSIELLNSMLVASLREAESGRWAVESDALKQIELFLRWAETARVRVYARFLAVDERCIRAALVAAGTRPNSRDQLTRRVRWELWRYLESGERASRLNRTRECQHAAEANENWGMADETPEERGGVNLHWEHEQSSEK